MGHHLGHLGHQGHLGHLGHLDHMGHLDHLVHLGQKEALGPLNIAHQPHSYPGQGLVLKVVRKMLTKMIMNLSLKMVSKVLF